MSAAAEALAQLFHETYERLAPDFGYRTREASAKPWSDVPEQNKALMVATCAEVLSNEPRIVQGLVIRPGDTLVVAVDTDLTLQEAERYKNALCERLPDVDVIVLAARSVAAYRPDSDE